MGIENLTERELVILEAVVRNFILSGSPTGSRLISRTKGVALSAATVRNVMMDLEEDGFITHPHTSAGRIPTDKGYRYYVDRLMRLMTLPLGVQDEIKHYLADAEPTDLRMVMEAVSRALSRVTRQLGVVLAPRLNEGVLRHVHLFRIGERRCLLHLTIDSGFVKTLAVEFESSIDGERLDRVCAIMNDRLCGRPLGRLFEPGDPLYEGIEQLDIGVIRLFMPSIRKMVQEQREEEVYAEGETNIVLSQNQFDRSQVNSIVEILEQKKLLMHVFADDEGDRDGVVITIGGENKAGQLESFSIIKTRYRIGNMEGTLGVIGPKRMPYGYLVSAVDYTAKMLSELY
jgi:heat-inducible transcriptional repressor